MLNFKNFLGIIPLYPHPLGALPRDPQKGRQGKKGWGRKGREGKGRRGREERGGGKGWEG